MHSRCTISQLDQDDEKVMRNIGVRKRSLMNEADINPSIVLEDEVNLFPITKSNRFALKLLKFSF